MKMIGKLFPGRSAGMATGAARKSQTAPLEALGLSERPFREARHGFLLARSEASGTALERLVEDCRRGGQVLFATASVADIQRPLGVLLAGELEREFLTASIQADLLMGADEVLDRISESLLLATGHAYAAHDMMRGLAEFLETQEQFAGLVVQIEDAHELGADVIDALLELAADPSGGSALRLVLWGERYLWDSLEYLLGERGLAGALVEIPPFTRDDISDYLEHCLVECGYAGDFPFSETQIEKIFLESQSAPHMIDALADDELESLAATAPGRRRSFSLPLPHALAASVLLASLGALYAWQDVEFNFDGIAAPARDASAGRVVVPIRVASVNAASAPAQAREPAALAALEPEPARGKSEAAEQAQPEPVADEAEDSSVTAADLVSTVTPQAAPPAPEPAAAAGGETEPEPAVPTLAEASAPEKTAPEKAVPAPAVAQAAARVEPVSTTARTPLEDYQTRLRALPAEHYFLQLMGTFSEQSARDFIASNGSGENFYYFRSEYQDKPWYVVVYGSFADRKQAASALDKLPEALRKTSPWVRSGEEIQHAMAQR